MFTVSRERKANNNMNSVFWKKKKSASFTINQNTFYRGEYKVKILLVTKHTENERKS